MRDDGEAPVRKTIVLGEAGGAIRGVVVGEGGAPNGGAMVLAGPESPSLRVRDQEDEDLDPTFVVMPSLVRTDEEGRFEVAGVEAGTVSLAAGAEGFAPYSGAVEVPAGGTAEITIRLDPEARISGTVTDPAGRPRWGIRVETHAPWAYSSRFLTSRATTGPDGSFRITNLRSGVLRVYVIEGDRLKATRSFDLGAGEDARYDPVIGPGVQIAGGGHGSRVAGGLPGDRRDRRAGMVLPRGLRRGRVPDLGVRSREAVDLAAHLARGRAIDIRHASDYRGR
jgi:hypothetical protein